MSDEIKELESYIEKIIADWHVPGGAVSVVKDNEVISCRGYGLRELGKKDPVNADTVFGIGSNTKSFTAAGVGMLADEGKLGWDDLIIKHLPDFAMSDPWVTQEVTLRDMLSHRTGLGRSMRLLYNKTFSNEEVIRRLRYLEPIDKFRNQFGYNNFHYMVAGLVIEAVTGKSWPEFIAERFFEPLGMKRSFPDLKTTIGYDNLSGAHANIDDSLLPHHARLFAPEVVVPWDDVGNQPAGGINSTASDLTHWMQMLLANGVWEGKTLLSKAVIDQMITPCSVMFDPMSSMLAPIAMLNTDTHFFTYGMGWFVMDYKGNKMYMHGGQITGFNSAVVLLPEVNAGFSILLSSHQTVCHMPLVFILSDFLLGANKHEWSQEFIGLLQQFDQMEQAGYQQLVNSRQENTRPSLSNGAYAGDYYCDLMGNTSVVEKNGNLVMRYGTGYVGELVH